MRNPQEKRVSKHFMIDFDSLRVRLSRIRLTTKKTANTEKFPENNQESQKLQRCEGYTIKYTGSSTRQTSPKSRRRNKLAGT